MIDPVPGEDEAQELCSIGWGLNTTIKENFDAGFYYGLPLRTTEETDRENGRWNFAFLLRW